VQRLQPRGLDVTAAFLTYAVEPLLEAPDHLIDCAQLSDCGVVDCLQGFVVLQLNRPIGGIAHQGIEPPLQIVLDALVSLRQRGTSRQQYLFDFINIYV
jgi:hypothetical protein